jgi:hypothetical protein
MLDRTMMRPRDVILFFNRCISLAEDNPRIVSSMVKDAEGEYSRTRLRALADEWYEDYPNLIRFADILKNRNASFRLSDIAKEECENFCLNVLIEGVKSQDELYKAVQNYYASPFSHFDFCRSIVKVFYRVGLVGVKLERYETISWSFTGHREVSFAEIGPETGISVHPFAWRTLGIRDLKRR